MITSIASVGRCPKPDALVNQRERLLKKEPSGEAGLGGEATPGGIASVGLHAAPRNR